MTNAVRGLLASLGAALAAALIGAPAASAAATQVIATEPYGIPTAPVLWNGGVAWSSYAGIYASTGAGAPSRLAKVPVYAGYVDGYVLDAGGGTPDPSGDLVYGYLEENNQTPPMGPGDTNVPSPPIPYDSIAEGSGLITATGQATSLPACPASDPFADGAVGTDPQPSFDVSISGGAFAYGCPFSPSPGFLAVANVAAPAVTTRMLPGLGNEFELSGQYVAGVTATSATAGALEVESLSNGVATQIVAVPASEDPAQLALGADGALVVVGAPGASACVPVGATEQGQRLVQAWPTEWFAPGDTTPHPLGCFYSGVRRPVDGEWIGLAPTAGGGAALEAVALAGGTTSTLETFPNAEMYQGADFDGQSLAWAEDTCAGTQIKLTADVAAIAPDPDAPATCPVTFGAARTLRPGATGTVTLRVACPNGCVAVLALDAHGPLGNPYETSFVLGPRSAPTSESFRLTRKQLRYLRSHGRQRVTLTALDEGPGSAHTTSRLHVTLAP